jgi:hypothetical protein
VGVVLTGGYREYRDAPPSQWREVLDSLEEYEDDEEPTCVSLTSLDTEWSLGTFINGHTVWMNLGRGGAQHMSEVPRERVFALWELLAAGRVEDIDREPWRPGDAPD